MQAQPQQLEHMTFADFAILTTVTDESTHEHSNDEYSSEMDMDMERAMLRSVADAPFRMPSISEKAQTLLENLSKDIIPTLDALHYKNMMARCSNTLVPPVCDAADSHAILQSLPPPRRMHSLATGTCVVEIDVIPWTIHAAINGFNANDLFDDSSDVSSTQKSSAPTDTLSKRFHLISERSINDALNRSGTVHYPDGAEHVHGCDAVHNEKTEQRAGSRTMFTLAHGAKFPNCWFPTQTEWELCERAAATLAEGSHRIRCNSHADDATPAPFLPAVRHLHAPSKRPHAMPHAVDTVLRGMEGAVPIPPAEGEEHVCCICLMGAEESGSLCVLSPCAHVACAPCITKNADFTARWQVDHYVQEALKRAHDHYTAHVPPTHYLTPRDIDIRVPALVHTPLGVCAMCRSVVRSVAPLPGADAVSEAITAAELKALLRSGDEDVNAMRSKLFDEQQHAGENVVRWREIFHKLKDQCNEQRGVLMRLDVHVQRARSALAAYRDLMTQLTTFNDNDDLASTLQCNLRIMYRLCGASERIAHHINKRRVSFKASVAGMQEAVGEEGVDQELNVHLGECEDVDLERTDTENEEDYAMQHMSGVPSRPRFLPAIGSDEEYDRNQLHPFINEHSVHNVSTEEQQRARDAQVALMYPLVHTATVQTPPVNVPAPARAARVLPAWLTGSANSSIPGRVTARLSAQQRMARGVHEQQRRRALSSHRLSVSEAYAREIKRAHRSLSALMLRNAIASSPTPQSFTVRHGQQEDAECVALREYDAFTRNINGIAQNTQQLLHYFSVPNPAQ